MSSQKTFSRSVLLVLGVFICCSHLSIRAQPKAQKQGPKTKVETRYDEKKNRTYVASGPYELWKPPENSVSGEINYERVDLSVSFSYPGKKVVKPKSVTVMLFSSSDRRAEFERQRELVISMDSDQKNFGHMELINASEDLRSRNAFGALTRVYWKALSKDIEFSDLEQLSESKKVDLKVGERKFKLTEAHLSAFRNFVSLMKQEGLEF